MIAKAIKKLFTKKTKGDETKMAKQIEKKDEKVEEITEKEVKKDEIKTECDKETDENVEEVADKKVEETTDKDAETETDNEHETEEPQVVIEEKSAGLDGIPLSEIPTRTDVDQRLDALEAKLLARFDELVKENEHLKEENARLHGKYENGDFGTSTSHLGEHTTDKKSEYVSFDEYAKSFG